MEKYGIKMSISEIIVSEFPVTIVVDTSCANDVPPKIEKQASVSGQAEFDFTILRRFAERKTVPMDWKSIIHNF